MNSTVSLDARIFDSGKLNTPPVAPPRKKRTTLKKGSTLPTSFGDGAVPNGFKDVFINGGVSKVFKHEEIKRIEKEDNVVQTQAVFETKDELSRERTLKVGNKKTDKFFGESLSDHLSNEPLKVEESVAKDDVDVNYTADKKLFFLMNMLDQEHDDDNDEIKCEIAPNNNEEPINRYRYDEEDDDVLYKGKLPVEEPLFIARKKEIKKHICDDDDHMHHQHFHSHEKESSDHIIAPPKPDRDFTKYHSNPAEMEEKALEEVKAEEIQAKPRVKKAISRECLPSPPEVPKRKSGVGSLPGTPTITIESFDFNTSNESVKAHETRNVLTHENVEPVQAKTAYDIKTETKHKTPAPLVISRTQQYESSQNDETPTPPMPQTPIITHEIMDHVFKKAYGFHGFNPEDTEHNHDDGSNLVAPKSKLTTRKISVGRKVSTESQPSSNDGDFGRYNELLPPGSPRKKISFSDDPSISGERDDGNRAPPTSPMKNRDYQQILKAASMKDIIDEIYSKNSDIMIEFQSYLEKSIETQPVINVEEEKEFLKAKGISDHEFTRTPEPKLSENNDEDIDDSHYSDSFESTDNEQETITDMGAVPMKPPKFNTRRRESIEDVDGWFNNHLKMDQNESDVCGFMEGTEPSSTPTYDHQKTFPFGRTIIGRRDSSSEEFFAGLPQSITRTNIGPLRESESSISDEERSRDDDRQKSPDHSTLLKFLETKEAKEII